MEVIKPSIGDLSFYPKVDKFGEVIEIILSNTGEQIRVKIYWPNLLDYDMNPTECVDPVPSEYLIFTTDHSEKTKLALRLKYGNK